MNLSSSGGGINEPIEISSLVDRFLEHLPSRLDQFDLALNANDWVGIERLAHQVRGASGCYGFPDIAKEAQRIEAIARTQSSATSIREGLERIRCMVGRIHS